MFAMISRSSRSTPRWIWLSFPPPAMYPAGSSSTGWKSASAGIDVMNVMMNSTPKIRAFLWSVFTTNSLLA